MNVAKRSKHLRSLLDVRIGPGAAFLPPTIHRLHLEFAFRIEGGHAGPRKFWRSCLPRLQYHNPQVKMTVARSRDLKSPAVLSVYSSANNTTAPPPQAGGANSNEAGMSKEVSTLSTPSQQQEGQGETVETIDMKDRTDHEILARFMDISKARPYEATAEEVEEVAELAEWQQERVRASERALALNRTRAREEKILNQARGLAT